MGGTGTSTCEVVRVKAPELGNVAVWSLPHCLVGPHDQGRCVTAGWLQWCNTDWLECAFVLTGSGGHEAQLLSKMLAKSRKPAGTEVGDAWRLAKQESVSTSSGSNGTLTSQLLLWRTWL